MEYRYPEKNELSERKLQELSSDTRSSEPTESFDQNSKENKLDEIADLNSSFEDQPAERTEHEYPEKAELLENIIVCTSFRHCKMLGDSRACPRSLQTD